MPLLTFDVFSHFDREDEREKAAFEKNMEILRTKLQQALPFKCKDFQEVKPNILITKEKIEKERIRLDEAKSELLEATARSVEEQRKLKEAKSQLLETKSELLEATARSVEEKRKLEKAKSQLLEACAKSDPETASKFISNLNRNFTSLMHYFPYLLNACLQKVKVVFEVLADGVKSKAESEVVSSLNPVVEDLCQSLILCLDNVTTQNKLIDEKLVFFVAREKHLGDLKSEREIDLKRAKLDLELAKQEIEQVEDEVRLAEHGVREAREAVQVQPVDHVTYSISNLQIICRQLSRRGMRLSEWVSLLQF